MSENFNSFSVEVVVRCCWLRLLKDRDQPNRGVKAQSPECLIWSYLVFGPVAGNLLAYPVGPSESSCNCEVAVPLMRPILSFSFPKWTTRLDRESSFL